MSTWIGFLRAINLGGKRKFSPSEVVTATEAAGFGDVATHINTGNVRFTTSMRSRERITGALEKAYAADRGFEVPCAVLTPAELAQIAAEGVEIRAGHPGMHYISILRDQPTPEAVAALEVRSTETERAVVRGRAVHLLVAEDYRGSGLNNTVVERLVGVATNRNHRVLEAIAAKWC